MGWYGGDGARMVSAIENIEGENQGHWDPLGGIHDCNSCTIDPSTLLIAANWKRSLQVKIGDDWVSGYYLVRFHELEHDTIDVCHLHRAGRRLGRAGACAGFDEHVAGVQHLGRCEPLRVVRRRPQYVQKSRRAYRVSYDRPYDPTLRGGKSYGAGEFFGFGVQLRAVGGVARPRDGVHDERRCVAATPSC